MSKYQNIKRLCKEKGVSVSQMERDLGFARGSIAKIDDHAPGLERVSKICGYLGISPSDLVSPDTPVYEIAAGNGRINDALMVCEPVSLYGDYSTVKIVGDSMYPILHDGDVVKVHHQAETAPTDLTVVKINGESSTIKYLEITSDGIWLRAENKDVFPDKHYTIAEVMSLPITVIGKAVSLERKL